MITGFWGYISAVVAIGITIVILGIAGAVLKALYTGKIDLTYLLAESADPLAQAAAQDAGIVPPAEGEPVVDAAAVPVVVAQAQPPETPKASISRLQLLIFTFVIGGLYLILCLESGKLVDIPNSVILLLGVSSTTYAASKTIKAASDAKSQAQ